MHTPLGLVVDLSQHEYMREQYSASFVFLQSIEFPKDKVSASVEKEGPVITTYEEPIDTENDFGNITNTTKETTEFAPTIEPLRISETPGKQLDSNWI